MSEIPARFQSVVLCRCGCGQPTLIAQRASRKRGWAPGQAAKVIAGHSTAPRRTLRERFGSRYTIASNGCWLWDGCIHLTGYGSVTHGAAVRLLAHRASYELHNGPIPDGLHIDHTCHNADLLCPGGNGCLHRRCVNPAHLEAVTQGENNRRMTGRRVAA